MTFAIDTSTFTAAPVETFSQAIETNCSLNALKDIQRQLDNFRAQLTATGAEHPAIDDYTDSLAGSLSDAWDDSGATSYLREADDALIRFDDRT